ncbi:pyruvate dehydrogenase protein X component, mitochondrial-like [Lineus longissimus]|uniref:pyruvate dehydrogenase protein X component, mitochondrial-like n=1 Tax=Lineus longissimus TaxID=88925 RepID=UPI002B4E4143
MANRLQFFPKIASKIRWSTRFLGANRLNKLYNDKTTHLHTSPTLFDAIGIKMPSLSPTMEEGTILKYYKKEGDPIAPGDILCEIQTDKAVVAFELDDEGTLAKILKPENSKDVKIGTLIAVMVEEGDDWQNAEIPAEEVDAAAPTAAVTEAEASPSPASKAAPTSPLAHGTELYGDGHLVGPAVKQLLEMYQINIKDVTPSGPSNTVMKGDVLKFVNENNLKPVDHTTAPVSVPVAEPATVAAPVPAAAPVTPTPVASPPPPPAGADFEDKELTSMRRTIAKRLTESKQTVPHTYSTTSCNMKNLIELRKQLKNDGIKVSVNDFIIKACAVALKRVPEVNAVWGGEAPRQLAAVDISVAVATDNGLITPIVTDAASLGVQDISEKVRDLAGRARIGKLQLHEFQGGSFTISNLGMFGITEFSAVINPPQASIMAIGTSTLELDTNGKPKTMMTVTLSSDARIVDDLLAAEYLEEFRDLMENPFKMLVGGKRHRKEQAEQFS